VHKKKWRSKHYIFIPTASRVMSFDIFEFTVYGFVTKL
jgi:hypothetical protein